VRILDSGENLARPEVPYFTKKKLGLFNNRQFCGFMFKFVWAVYNGDLIGFCQSFNVILKNDHQQTKSKKSQKVPGYEPL
jgi:hypothetical protein